MSVFRGLFLTRGFVLVLPQPVTVHVTQVVRFDRNEISTRKKKDGRLFRVPMTMQGAEWDGGAQPVPMELGGWSLLW